MKNDSGIIFYLLKNVAYSKKTDQIFEMLSLISQSFIVLSNVIIPFKDKIWETFNITLEFRL